MAKISKESIEAQNFGPVEVREGAIGAYTVEFLTFKETQDMAPMFGRPPDGRCQCPHWAYVTKGRQTEVRGPRGSLRGWRFYVEPGHIPVFEAGTELIQFRPTTARR